MKNKRRFILFFLISIAVMAAGCSGVKTVTRRTTLPQPLITAAEPSPPRETPRVAPPAIPAPEGGGPAAIGSSETPESVPALPAPAPRLSQPLPSPSPPTAPVRPAPAAPSASPAAPARPRPQGQGVVFKFDNADLYEVIRTFAEVLKINYVVDPKVRGTVNIHTSGAIGNEDILPMFLSILRMNGATMVKRDSIYEIVPFAEGWKLPVNVEQGRRSPEDQFTIEVIKPNFIPVSELEKVVKPFLSDDKELISFPQNNMVIVGDLASNIRKLRDILSLIDIDIFSNMSVRIYPVYNSDATDMAKDLSSIFTAFGISSKEAKGGGITFTPITRANSLLVISSMPGIMERVENWIRELDKPPSAESKVWVHVYYVQNAKAKDLAEVLKQVYVKTKETRPTPAPTPAPTPTPGQKPAPTPAPRPTPTPTPTAASEGAGVVEGEINIVVDEQNNALVIRALARDYKVIQETIQKLDIYPKQVLIDVLLAQVTLDDSLKYGIEWAQFQGTHGNYKSTFVGIATPPPLDKIPDYLGGFRYSIIEAAGRVSAAINAAAADNRLNVISSPHILASNNKEAKIQIGSEQPILTNTYTSTATTTSDVITGSIEYKDIGVILTVTPRISDAGLITLEIQLENSTAGTTTLGTNNNLTVPVFDKKTAKTTLSVMEGQMIVIGGIIEDTKKANKTGIPFLSEIPILGGLFGYHDFADTKKETLLLMTPHLISDENKSRAVTDEFRQKLREIQRSLEEQEKQKR